MLKKQIAVRMRIRTMCVICCLVGLFPACRLRPASSAEQVPSHPTTKQDLSVPVTIHVILELPGCGGTPQHTRVRRGPLRNMHFVVKPGTENNIRVYDTLGVTTDSSGTIKVNLQPGCYLMLWPMQCSVVDTAQVSDTKFIHYDKTCLAAWHTHPLLRFEVTKEENQKFELVVKRDCFVTGWSPCEHYVGPPVPVRRH